jgi:hypothetical protein
MRTGVMWASVLAVCTGCSSTSSGTQPSETTGPCDPLATPPTTLSTVIGVGKDDGGVYYVGDIVNEFDSGALPLGLDRVFVSQAGTLVRKHVAGSGSGQDSYSLDFEDTPGDSADSAGQALLIQTSQGKATAMALGPATMRTFVVGAAGQTPLAVVDPSEVAKFPIQNLPNAILHVADVSDGTAIVLVAPGDAYGTDGYQLFYGKPGAMVGYPIVGIDGDDYGEYIQFLDGQTTYNIFFNEPFELDGGSGPHPGSLYTGTAQVDPAFGTPTGALAVTERTPTPTTLSGFSFTCRSSGGT